MVTSEVGRSELVRSMVDLGTLLTGPKSLDERMTGLCRSTSQMLRADIVAIALREGRTYRGMYQNGLTGDLARNFRKFTVPKDRPIVPVMEACDSYLLFHEAKESIISHAAHLGGLTSVIIVPFTHPDGDQLGFIAVCYVSDKRLVTTFEAELATGLARMAQTTLLRDLEVRRRREVSEALLEVADSERRRLSRDIHDDPLQRILGLRIGLESFRLQLTDPARLRTLDRFIDQCHQTSASLREVMLSTRPGASELRDLHDVLRGMVSQVDRGKSISLTFSDERSEESPSYLVPAINRIAEQAARNTLHHAQASNLAVRLSDHNDGTLLEVADNGTGFDPQRVHDTRLGIVSMRERTELLNGRFTIDSAPGAGTSIAAWFPHQVADRS